MNRLLIALIVVVFATTVASCGPSQAAAAITASALAAVTQTAEASLPASTLDLNAAGTQIAALTATQLALSGMAEATYTAETLETAAAAQTEAALKASETPTATRTPRPTRTPPSTQTQTPTQTVRPAATLPPATPANPTSAVATAGPDAFVFSGQVVYRHAPVAGAKVTVRHAITGQEFNATTDAGGYFVFPGLVDGRWVYRATTGNLVSLVFEGGQEEKCRGFLYPPGQQCIVEAAPRGSAVVTIRMARTDLIQFKEHTRTATNITMVGDIAWEPVADAVEYRILVSGQFRDGWEVYTNRLVHETFMRTGSLYSEDTVPGQCYTHEVSAWGVEVRTDPIAWASFVLCRPE